MVKIAASSARRVPEHTSADVNHQIEQQTMASVECYAARPDLIEQRLMELDNEWDIERAIEANAATLALGGSLLALLVHRRFAVLPAVVSGFLLQHAIQGWCPPVPILRRLGFRTAQEIEAERYALMAMRGDFDRFAIDHDDPAGTLAATGRFESM